jgi:hypothetical protein
MIMYDISKGVTGLSNSLNSQIAQFQLAAQKANQDAETAKYAATMGLIGSALEGGGSALGGFLGGKGGGK